MNELTLHYVNQADRERSIAEDLRNRQILETANPSTESAERPSPTPATASVARPSQAPVRARAVGR